MSKKKSPNGAGRLGRDKKKKALDSEEYKLNVEKLASRGVTGEDIQTIYDKCQQKPQTKVARDTLASKLVILLEYFDTRNEGIEENSSAYISKDNAIQMIMKNPRIINSDINKNIIVKCQVLTDKKESVREANMLIKSNPGVFRKTVKTIKEGR